MVVGSREEAEVEMALPGLTDYVRGLYEAARSMPMGRWLMIRVTDQDILRDVKLLMGIRVKPKAR
ncbi:hypothetical protein SDC9_212675 [bioreactor metagenome]|uniref:Uncharacterized protein n=1 Tax=bioreactor metagenome TaxID=1076179 RepID=A0A645JNH5_9ZZZZ